MVTGHRVKIADANLVCSYVENALFPLILDSELFTLILHCEESTEQN